MHPMREMQHQLRKAATKGATHRSLFFNPEENDKKTLILIDEVDHLSGGLRSVSESRINDAIKVNLDSNDSVQLKEIPVVKLNY